jgi:hypothetical protein
MAATKTTQLKKIIDDAELREHAISALHSVQQAVEDAKGTEQKISKRAQKKLKKAEAKLQNKGTVVKEQVAEKVETAKPAVAPKDEAKPKKKRHPVRKLIVIGTIGAVVALVVSEDARKAVLDALFGAEEEFEYTSSTTAGASTNGTS